MVASVCFLIVVIPCNAVSAEFRSYFEHVRSLRFEDKPDYDYLKRLFRELFFRKGYAYDNIYDWDLAPPAGVRPMSGRDDPPGATPERRQNFPHPHDDLPMTAAGKDDGAITKFRNQPQKVVSPRL